MIVATIAAIVVSVVVITGLAMFFGALAVLMHQAEMGPDPKAELVSYGVMLMGLAIASSPFL